MRFLESDLPDSIFVEYEAEELKGFSRSTTEIQWLMLVIVLLYLCIPTQSVDSENALIVSMVGYAAFVVIFRYLGFFPTGSKWQLAIETLAMTAFITIVAWYTGKMDSPLLSLYLLVIITCAITLGKTMTLLE
ncbi:MAG: GGDEF domain-containing protein, partial [Gammaproteobacteria bacterium]